MTNKFKPYQNVMPMKIAMVHRTHANLAFVTVDQMRNALNEPIHVQLDTVNVVLMMSAYPQKLALLGSVKVSNMLSQIFMIYTVVLILLKNTQLIFHI